MRACVRGFVSVYMHVCVPKCFCVSVNLYVCPCVCVRACVCACL